MLEAAASCPHNFAVYNAGMMPNYYPLLERVQQWLKIRQRLADVPVPTDVESFNQPFITIAREPGSGGEPIAKKVAELLKFEFVDEQIIDQIAHSTKRRKAVIQQIDEKSRSKIEDVVHSLINKDYVDDSTYVSALVKIILAHAFKGKCVILGRGANFITPFACGLHVNVTAPYSVRVQRAMDYEGHNKQKAKEVIAEVEEERRMI